MQNELEDIRSSLEDLQGDSGNNYIMISHLEARVSSLEASEGKQSNELFAELLEAKRDLSEALVELYNADCDVAFQKSRAEYFEEYAEDLESNVEDLERYVEGLRETIHELSMPSEWGFIDIAVAGLLSGFILSALLNLFL